MKYLGVVLFMLHSNEIEFRNEQGIFPIVVFERKTQNFRCIGTAFFINGLGLFVTAKHVIVGEVTSDKMMIVVQSLSNGETVGRQVTEVCIHPVADIAVGVVGIARDPLSAQEAAYEIAPSCRLSFKFLEAGTELLGFGYPKTKKDINANLHTFTLQGTWSDGIIEDFHPEGMSWLKNRCYQTTMNIESGSSGGPVFHNGYVVGINSSSFDLSFGELPISFITPIDFLLQLQLTIGEELLSIAKMIEKGMIIFEPEGS